MTIEELRGANDFLSDAQIAIDNCEQEIDYEAVRTIRGLINAEIARLRAYRTEPCEWCKGKTWEDFDCSVYQEHDEDGDKLEVWQEIMTKRCPNCGRKLTED